MFKELLHHAAVHASQHPQEMMGAVAAAGKAIAPVAIAAAPYVAGAVIIGGAIWLIESLCE